MFELSVSCDELSVLFGCGGINLPDGSPGPLPAIDNSALYDLAFLPCHGTCLDRNDSVLTSFLLFLGVDIGALSCVLLLGVWNASPSKVIGLILLKPYPMSFSPSDLILEKNYRNYYVICFDVLFLDVLP